MDKKAEYLDKDGKGICGRCAAEAGLIKKDADGCWIGLQENKNHRVFCWSCNQMEDEIE